MHNSCLSPTARRHCFFLLSISTVHCFAHDNALCAGQKAAGSKHGKSKRKGDMGTTKVKDTADNSSVAASTAQAAVKGKEKVQKHATRKAKKGKLAGRVGLINPTAAEIKTAFSMLNPHNRSVISAQDVARVGPLSPSLSACRMQSSNLQISMQYLSGFDYSYKITSGLRHYACITRSSSTWKTVNHNAYRNQFYDHVLFCYGGFCSFVRQIVQIIRWLC